MAYFGLFSGRLALKVSHGILVDVADLLVRVPLGRGAGDLGGEVGGDRGGAEGGLLGLAGGAELGR